jgi:hypothetical protein
MILTANSEVVRQTRRKTGNGWPPPSSAKTATR